MKALLASVAALSVALTGASSEPCKRAFGVAYDELHSFRVEAPAGWCCAQAEEVHNCRPAGSAEATPVVSISFRYLDTPNADLAALAPGELASFAPGGLSVEQRAVGTQNGGVVRVWQVSGPGSKQSLVGLLVHELILVRFVLEQPSSPAGRSSSAEAFRHLLSSFRGSPQAA